MARPTVLIEDFADMLGFDNPAPQAEPAALSVQGGITEMKFSDMESFPNHKFKLYEGQRLADMADSIKQFGILLPIILWHTEDDKYFILSGHNRRNAAMLAGLDVGPVIIKELLHLMVKSSVAQNKTNRDTIQLDFPQKACKVA